MVDVKICSMCGLEKPLTEFYLNAGTRNGYSSICKECQKESSRRYANANKEKLREYKRKRYLKRKQEFAELKALVEENGFNKRDN